MIKAIIFDCFGVLTGEGLVPFRERYFGHDPQLLANSKQLSRQMVLGGITFEYMLEQLANAAGVTYDDAAEEIEAAARLKNDELLNFIRDILKPTYKIGVLSNIAEHKFETIFSTEDIALFDATALSWKIGYAKPDPEAYKIAARMLGVRPFEALFVDDRSRYIEGAKEVGMTTIKYESFSQFYAELDEILNTPDREKQLTLQAKGDII